MNQDQATPKPKRAAKQETSGGWVRRFVHYLLKTTAATACIMIMLWLVKCPGELELWRAIGVGLMIPIISRFL